MSPGVAIAHVLFLTSALEAFFPNTSKWY